MARLLLLILAFAAAISVASTAANAHAVVLDTVPADGAVLATAPTSVLIRFNEPVSLISTQVLAPDGSNVVTPGSAHVHNQDLEIALPAKLPQGSYVVSYRVVSLDSHPVAGSVVFSVGTASPAPAAMGEGAEAVGWRIALLGLRVIFYAGLLCGTGGALFLAFVRPPDRDTTAGFASTAAVLGALAALFSIGAQGGLLLAVSPTALFQPQIWATGLSTTLGRSALTAAGGLGLIAACIRFRKPVAEITGPLGAAIALASIALTGHVVTSGPLWLTAPLVVVHAACAAFWIGALVPLYRALQFGTEAAAVLERFSRLALGAVAVLFVAGLAIAVLQVGTIGALTGTAYGRVLLLKLALVVILLSLATLNRLRLTPALARGAMGAANSFRVSIAAELCLAAGILIATVMLGTTPPPRALAAVAQTEHVHHEHGHGDFFAEATSGDRRVRIAIAPGHAGPNMIDITIAETSGAPIEVKELTVEFSNPAAGVEPIRRSASKTGLGAWRAEALLSPSGAWMIRVHALISEFEKVSFDAEVRLRD
jgi:copper transport protein